jgi:tyrosine-protein phosphatase YwqE
MFGLFKKKKDNHPQQLQANYSFIGTDMHSHLLPGIDDGSPDAETSVQHIRRMMELGFKKFITTPHIYPDLYPNNTETILAALGRLKDQLQKEQLNVKIHAAAEYFIDDLFAERLAKNEKLLTLHSNHVLVEISFMAPPPDLNDNLFNLIMNGYQPVLAHPERYNFYHSKKEAYHRFKDQGCLLQVNLLSLSGYYGRSVQEAALYLVQEKLVDYIGTDLHHTRHLDTLAMPSVFEAALAAAQSNTILNPSL